MKHEFLHHHRTRSPHGFHPSWFFAVAGGLTIAVVGFLELAFRLLGREAVANEHRAAVILFSVLAGLIASSLIFDHDEAGG
jgi:hypothetical protein